MRKRIIRRTSISESRVVRRPTPPPPDASGRTSYRIVVVAEDAAGARRVYERGPFDAVDVEEGAEGSFRLTARATSGRS